jgi:hypothetical protein
MKLKSSAILIFLITFALSGCFKNTMHTKAVCSNGGGDDGLVYGPGFRVKGGINGPPTIEDTSTRKEKNIEDAIKADVAKGSPHQFDCRANGTTAAIARICNTAKNAEECGYLWEDRNK